MKKISTLLMAAVMVFSGCRTEEDAGPATEKTFIRFLGSENNNLAVLGIEAGDGFTLLSTTEILLGSAQADYKIRLSRLDQYGNLVWEQSYPAFDQPHTDMKASSFMQLSNSGYLIIGDRIEEDGTTAIQVLVTDDRGTLVQEKIISGQNNYSLHGHAVTQTSTGDFIVLGSIVGNPSEDMFAAKLDGSTLDEEWRKGYGDGAGNNNVLNRLYANGDTEFLWGTSWRDPSTNNQKPRVIAVPENSETPLLGPSIGDPTLNQVAMDLCKINTGWVITGYTSASGNEDSYIMKVTNSSQLVFQQVLTAFPDANDRGVSVCTASDGGYVMLGNVSTADNGQDLFISKFNLDGSPGWGDPGFFTFGNSETQEAASIRRTSDGSYLIFGTTYFKDDKKLMVLKVNSNGQL